MCEFLEEMMGFSDALIPRAREHLPLFDPAMVGVDTLESDDTSDGEGTSHFLSQALQGSPGYTIGVVIMHIMHIFNMWAT